MFHHEMGTDVLKPTDGVHAANMAAIIARRELDAMRGAEARLLGTDFRRFVSVCFESSYAGRARAMEYLEGAYEVVRDVQWLAEALDEAAALPSEDAGLLSVSRLCHHAALLRERADKFYSLARQTSAIPPLDSAHAYGVVRMNAMSSAHRRTRAEAPERRAD